MTIIINKHLHLQKKSHCCANMSTQKLQSVLWFYPEMMVYLSVRSSVRSGLNSFPRNKKKWLELHWKATERKSENLAPADQVDISQNVFPTCQILFSRQQINATASAPASVQTWELSGLRSLSLCWYQHYRSIWTQWLKNDSLVNTFWSSPFKKKKSFIYRFFLHFFLPKLDVSCMYSHWAENNIIRQKTCAVVKIWKDQSLLAVKVKALGYVTF